MKLGTILTLIVALVFTAALFGLEVSFKPFSVKLTNWQGALAWLFFFVALGVLISVETLKTDRTAYRKGLEDGGKITLDVINDKLKPYGVEFIKKGEQDTELTITPPGETINE